MGGKHASSQIRILGGSVLTFLPLKAFHKMLRFHIFVTFLVILRLLWYKMQSQIRWIIISKPCFFERFDEAFYDVTFNKNTTNVFVPPTPFSVTRQAKPRNKGKRDFGLDFKALEVDKNNYN